MVSTGLDWVKHRARLTPDKIALVDIDANLRLTYEALNQRAESVAAFLQNKGIRKGDRIAILAPNDIAFFDLIFASAKIGSILVPFNTRFGLKEIEYLLDDSKPKLLFIHPEYLASIVKLNTPPLILLTEKDDSSPRTETEAIPYQQVVKFPAANQMAAEISMENPWLIIYTGGTTGFPKGAVLTYRSVIWNSLNTIISWGIKENDITVTYMPLYHTGGINALSMPVLHMGGTVIIGKKYDPEKAVQIIEEERCTILLLVPTMYHMMIKTKAFQNADFPSMHTFLSGGAPCPFNIYNEFQAKGLNFKEGYGLTEAGPNNFYINPIKAYQKKGSVGKPMFYNEVKIVDDDGKEMPTGEVGEIWLAGPHLFDYYWNKEEETNKAFHHKWFKTGDLGRKDQDGDYYIVGRKKDMIISGGENIYPLEIENVLHRHPSIEEASVVGLPDEKWGEVVTAFIVMKNEKELREVDEKELKAYLISHLAGYKLPKKYHFVKELPKTSIGKISKADLVKQYLKGEY